MILDTSFIIDVQRGDEGAVGKARDIEGSDRPLRVPHVVLYELYIGVGKGVQSEENEELIQGVVGSLPLEPTTPAIARRAGRIEGRLQKGGDAVGAVDSIVAATAISYDEPVLTADAEDFGRIRGLDVETYR